MNIAVTVSRILLGLVFTFFGAMAFFVTSAPPLPGMAGTFNTVFIHSHWALFVGGAQLVLGVLLLVNRFVPIALIMLAAFLYNSFAFHLTMFQSGLPGPILVLALWLIIALKHRAAFTQLVRA